MFKSVQYWRKDQQLLLGYYCRVVLENACCLTSEQNAVIANGHVLQLDSPPAHTAHNTIDYLNKRTSTS